FALSARYSLPTVYPFRFMAREGGLVSYGVDLGETFPRAAEYFDRILGGVKPAELPVQAPTKFELVINLKTARTLGLEVPPTLLAGGGGVSEGSGGNSSRCLGARRWHGRSRRARSSRRKSDASACLCRSAKTIR